MLIELPSTLAGAKKLAPVGPSWPRQPYGGLADPDSDREPLGFLVLCAEPRKTLAEQWFQIC